MKAIDFPEKNQDIGKGQEQYIVLPAKIIMSDMVPVWSKWEPSEEDLKKLNNGGCIWMNQLTMGNKFQPVLLTTKEPDFKALDEEAERKADAIIQELSRQHKAGKIQLDDKQVKQLRAKMKGLKNGSK